MISAIRPEADSVLFTLAMASIGIGIGLAISQIGNVNLSSADQSRSTEIGGMQGTAQNLGPPSAWPSLARPCSLPSATNSPQR